MSTSLEERPATAPRHGAGTAETISLLAMRVRAEYREMPGLRLTVRQAARLFSVSLDVADAVLHELQRASILTCSNEGAFALMSAPSGDRAPVSGSLSDASLDRLACLSRHWAWADEAKTAFDRELADGWHDDDDPISDHPFGSYYHWCALLCGFSEAALEHGLLSPFQLDAIRQDLEVSLPGLRACRQLLVVIPASLEEQPRVVTLIRDDDTLRRLRRVHNAFGDALREERRSREIDSLDH